MRRVPQVRGLSLGLEVAVPPTIDVIVRTKALSPLVRITIRYNYFLDFFPVSYILALFLKEVGGRNRKVPPCPHNSLAKLLPSLSLPPYFVTSLLHFSLKYRGITTHAKDSTSTNGECPLSISS
jgi:hypothetical protein